jgi:hypothetical protein
MKKTNSKLQLKTNTLRVLQGSQLAQVNGGAPTAFCTEQGPGCSVHSQNCPGQHSDNCPPQHTKNCP